jgi:hypothetical protein
MSSARAVSGRAGARPLRREAGSARGRLRETLSSKRPNARRRDRRARGASLQQEREKPASSKRPTPRSAGTRARRDRRGSRGWCDVVGSSRFRPSRSSAASKRSGAWSARGGLQRGPFLEAADLPVGRDASASRSARVAWLVRCRRFEPFPAEQELGRVEEKRGLERAGRAATRPHPRSGRPPGRPGRERVAIGEGRVAGAMSSVRAVSGRAGARPRRRGAGPGARGAGCNEALSSKRPTSRSAGTRARRVRRGSRGWCDVVGSSRFRPSRSSAASKRSGAWSARGGLQRGPILEAADLPVGRDASAWRSARSRGSCDVVDSSRFRPSRSSAASKRSGAWSARGGLQRGPILEAADLPVGRDASAWRSARSRGWCDVVGSCRFRPSRSSAASKRSGERAGQAAARPLLEAARPPQSPGRWATTRFLPASFAA